MRKTSLFGLALVACASGRAGTGTDGGNSGDGAKVSISPATPHTNDDLHAVVTNPATESYTFRWSVNGTARTDVSGLNVAAASTTKGEQWKVELLAGGEVVSSDIVTILNSAPAPFAVAIPASPASGAAIQCTITTPSSDADNDPITYTGAWERNGAAAAGATQTVFAGDTVPQQATGAVGDSWVCIVTASDGEAMTIARSSAAVIQDPCAGQPLPGPTTFQYNGATQVYTVGTCVKHVTIEVWGAQGGGPGGKGGNGGYARGNMDVTGGQTLFVQVGGQNGYNGGGAGVGNAAANGGGASDVRITSDMLANRVIVAGGGGGGYQGDVTNNLGGTGGGGACAADYCGGGGAAGYGGSGGAGGEQGGAGITAPHAGGAGGGGHSSGGGGSCETYDAPTKCGTTGSLGQGGAGESTQQAVRAVCYTSYGGTAGGGSGYYGGGGAATGFCGGGGGGGGSSWVGTLTSASMTAGSRAGNGQVTITPY
ncbi:MAG TPA: glycine-rich protein [Kofleriaceae bacterium]|nr:glycine-rich protein [Kofleriaceae bacterium]